VRRHHIGRTIVVALCAGGAVVGISFPVSALVARLTSLPLGKGAATITWTGNSGITPTVNSVQGHVADYSVVATDKFPRLGQSSSTTGSGSSSVPSSIPNLSGPIPFGDVKGTIDGTAFTLLITLQIPQTQSQLGTNIPLGQVTGMFRNEPIKASLSANPKSRAFDFKGSIGPYRVIGVIESVQHHGDHSTAHATFDVTQR